MISYITGSRAYGFPREDSDIDLVICASNYDVRRLWQLSRHFEGNKACTFGKLNLVLFDCENKIDMARYERWTEVNKRLVASQPVTKEKAIAAFRSADAEFSYLKTYPPDYRTKYGIGLR